MTENNIVIQECKPFETKQTNVIRGYHWKGGSHIKEGYIMVYKPDHPKSNKQGYVREHRLIYEQHYNCCLLTKSVIHHIDGNKQNNTITNLMVFISHSKHKSFEEKKDMTGRHCHICNSKTSKPNWYVYNGSFICNNCRNNTNERKEYLKNYKNKHRNISVF